MLLGYDVEIPEELADMEQVSVNIWICNNNVLRLVMNHLLLPIFLTTQHRMR